MIASNEVRFRPSGKLVVMQVSDAQDMKHVRKAMVNMLDNAYDMIKPDLVLFTGDNVLGNHLLDARFGTRQVAYGRAATMKALRESIDKIAAPLESRKIPFAMIFGNHDDRNLISKQEHADIYRRYSMCLPMNTGNGDVDCDTYNITAVSSSGGKPIFNMWMLDSAWYDRQNNKCYEEIKPQTVEWYKQTSERLTKENGGAVVPSLMFIHIPLPEMRNLVEKCGMNDPGAVKTHKNGWCRLKPECTRGIMNEFPSSVSDSAGLFDAVLECSDVRAIVTGHDHLNCFEGSYKGIDFVQSACASFRCYGNEMRGVRVFEIDERDPADYITYFFNYADLCGRGAAAKLRYFLDADEKEKQKTALITGAAVAASAAVGIARAVLKK